MTESYSVISDDTSAPNSQLPLGAIPQLESTGSVFRNAEMWLYRERTVALLRRYLRISIEVGRLPSLLGRELFRSKVTSYRMTSFEDGVIFVHDVERALEHLNAFAQQLVATIVFQDYTQDEAAEVLHCARRTVCREFPEALDRISELFLDGGLLNRLPTAPVENSCQEGKEANFAQAIVNKPNKFMQSMAQFPFQNAMLNLRVRKKGRAERCALSFCSAPPNGPPMPRGPIDSAADLADLSALRHRITELVAQNAVSIVQQAIDAVKEEGQYQAIKYLFEMIGLYPAAANDESEIQSSLTQTLLDHLGLREVTDRKTTAKRVTARDPLKLK